MAGGGTAAGGSLTAFAAWLQNLLGRLRPVPPGGAAMALEQVLALDARRRLCLVRCGGRRVVLLVGGTQDCVVGWLDVAEPAP